MDQFKQDSTIGKGGMGDGAVMVWLSKNERVMLHGNRKTGRADGGCGNTAITSIPV